MVQLSLQSFGQIITTNTTKNKPVRREDEKGRNPCEFATPDDQKSANRELLLRCGADEVSIAMSEVMTELNEAKQKQDAETALGSVYI